MFFPFLLFPLLSTGNVGVEPRMGCVLINGFAVFSGVLGAEVGLLSSRTDDSGPGGVFVVLGGGIGVGEGLPWVAASPFGLPVGTPALL